MMFGVVVLIVGVILSPVARADDPDYQLPGSPPNSRIVGNRRQCWNTAAFAVTGMLEIRQEMLTGQKVKFSEQEIVDCHVSGCDEDTRREAGEIFHWVRVQQRLAADDEYPEFNSKMDNDGNTCRASHAPNALQLDIGNLESVDLMGVEAALEEHGSVLAMINISPDYCPGYLKLKSEIDGMEKTEYMDIYQDNDDDGFLDGYMAWFTGEGGHVIRGGDVPAGVDHYVVIVGIYTDDDGTEYYIVRDSRGDGWMRRGHFLIERYSNTCGIENRMYYITATLNTDAVVGCPPQFPKYCSDTRTCTKSEQECVPMATASYSPEFDAPVKNKQLKDVSDRPECQDKPGYGAICANLAKTWKNCMSPSIQADCAGSCLMCNRDECEDVEMVEGECEAYKQYCYLTPVRAMCAVTCQFHPMDCGTLFENVDLLTGRRQTNIGPCYPPDIANGLVTAGDDGMIQHGDKLVITCDEGYELVGEENYCVIQNLYGPDSRLLQECVRTGDESWTGNGADYTGTKSTNIHGTKCSNTKQIAAQGIFDLSLSVEYARAALRGSNHNYCRSNDNVGVAPWCVTNVVSDDMFETIMYGEGADVGDVTVTTAQLSFCYDTPKCDYCDQILLPDGPLCGWFPMDCSLSIANVGVMDWDMCPNYCCSQIQCT